MRNAFSRALVDAARNDPRIVLLTGDHGYALFDEFRQVCPGQYVNAGVAEQNMVGVAAGLAKGGLRPVVYGLSAFVPVRVLEQIKLDICYEQLPVLLIGDGAGVVYSSLGTSHQSTEDIAALRALPHLSLLSPADAQETAACMKLALDSVGPVYLRMGKSDLGVVHAEPLSLGWGALPCVRRGQGPLAWIATGSMVKNGAGGRRALARQRSLQRAVFEAARRIGGWRDLPTTSSCDRAGRAFGIRRLGLGRGGDIGGELSHVGLPRRHTGPLLAVLRQLSVSDARTPARRRGRRGTSCNFSRPRA